MDLGRGGGRTLVSSLPPCQLEGVRLETFLELEEVSVSCEVVRWVKRTLGDHRGRC